MISNATYFSKTVAMSHTIDLIRLLLKLLIDFKTDFFKTISLK